MVQPQPEEMSWDQCVAMGRDALKQDELAQIIIERMSAIGVSLSLSAISRMTQILLGIEGDQNG